jgi:DNA-binding NarL/FixJ family response regulator
VRSRIRLLLVEDQPLLRAGLARLLAEDPSIELVGEAGDGREAVRLAAELKPDLVVMDIRMPVMDGVDATREILADQQETKVLILTAFETDSLVLQALKAGASGYLLKDAYPEDITAAIVTVMAGGRVMAGTVANRILGMASGRGSIRGSYDNLTAREIELLTLLASGMTNKQIALRLKLSGKTVRNHVSNIYEKLKIYDRSQAVLYAVRKGLVQV